MTETFREHRLAWFDARNKEIRETYLAGATLSEIQEEYGLSRSTVNRLLAGITRPPREPKVNPPKARRPPSLCPICNSPVATRYSTRRITCGGECSRAWNVLRTRIDDEAAEKHRRLGARGVLRKSSVSTGQLALAQAVLAGSAPPRNRRFFVRGSAGEYYAQKFGFTRDGTKIRSPRPPTTPVRGPEQR